MFSSELTTEMSCWKASNIYSSKGREFMHGNKLQMLQVLHTSDREGRHL